VPCISSPHHNPTKLVTQLQHEAFNCNNKQQQHCRAIAIAGDSNSKQSGAVLVKTVLRQSEGRFCYNRLFANPLAHKSLKKFFHSVYFFY
jgi:hypothetical protein